MHEVGFIYKISHSYFYTLSTYAKLYCVQGRKWRLCVYCVINTPQTMGHNVGRSIAVFQDSPTCPSEKCSTQVECTEVEQCYWQRMPEILRGQPAPLPLCPKRISQTLGLISNPVSRRLHSNDLQPRPWQIRVACIKQWLRPCREYFITTTKAVSWTMCW